MPVYVIEFVTSDARPQQRRFTLDDDRPLRPQVEHVLAELERAGLVLRGGPADELAVRWAGHEVDAARTPAELGVTPDRAVELRMQRRRAPLTVAPAPPPPEAPTTRFVPRSVYAGAALGAAGAWAAWTIAGTIADGSADDGLLGTRAGLNGVAAVLFGVVVGIMAGAGSARRSYASPALGAVAGGGAGGVAALLWAAVSAAALGGGADTSHIATPLAAIVARSAAWVCLGALVAAGVALATSRWTVNRGRVATAGRAAGWAALAGGAAGLLPALPGPVELWSALGACLAGAGVGGAAAWAAVRRAVGVLSLEARGDRGPGVVSLREWTLADGRSATIPDAAGAVGAVVTASGIVVTQSNGSGAPARPVRQEDRLTVGGMRYRFRRLATSASVLALVGHATRPRPVAAQPAAAQTAADPAASSTSSTSFAGPIDRVALVRCIADRALPCLQVRVTLPPAAAVRDALSTGADGAGLDDAADTASAPARATGWSGRLGPYVLEPVQVRIARAGGPRRAVLTLVDVSGSMKGDGMQVARAAVRSFLRDLGVGAAPGAVQAALGAFASRGVVAAVRGVAFAAPEIVAGNVDLLPPAGGNTGLYSAVAAGAERVAAAARDAGPGTRAALVVVTDGVNDVTDASGRPRADDDPALLRGPEGRAAAAATARRLGVDLYLVGVGPEPDMNELQALAGDQGRAFRTARDAVALRAALARVDAALAPTRDVLFAVPGAERASLARPEWRLTVTRDAAAPGGAAPASAAPAGAAGGGGAPGPAPQAEFAGMWPAPVVGTPVFAGAAFRADGRGVGAPAWLRAAAEESPAVERRVLVALFVALLVVIVWGLPRALWQPEPWPRAAVGAAPTVVSDAPVRQLPLRPMAAEPVVVARTGAGLAADVRDAPPRRPEDVTAQRVRRNGTRPASIDTGSAALPPAAPRRS